MKFSQRQVGTWLKKQEVVQMHTRPLKRGVVAPVSNRTSVPGYYQVDEIQLPPDHGFKYALTAIDIFSKYVFIKALRTSGAKDAARAMQSILDEAKEKGIEIKVIQHDIGVHFKAEFKQCLKRNNIRQIWSKPHTPMSNGCIEKLNGFAKTLIFKSVSNGKSWSQDLPIYVDNINNYKSFATGYSPITIERTPELWSEIAEKVNARISKKYGLKSSVDLTIPLGTKVRKLIDRKAFQGSSKYGYFSQEIYKVIKVVKSKYPGIHAAYKVEDMETGTVPPGLLPRSSLLVIDSVETEE